MTESSLSPLIKTAAEYLEAARSRLGHKPGQQAATYGLGLLSQVLTDVRTELESYELAELTSVYDTLAVQVADAFSLDVPAAFVALATLGQDGNAQQLVTGQPVPHPASMQLLRTRLVWVTVTYETTPGKPAKRVTEVVYKNPDGELRSGTAELPLGYEDLPGRVRDQMFASGERAVRFQLYPATPPMP